MKKATILFDELLDGFVYTVKSWLHLDLADNTIRDATIIAASSAFLFDKLFAKENAGEKKEMLGQKLERMRSSREYHRANGQHGDQNPFSHVWIRF